MMYIKNSPSEIRNANLKMVPYYVTKKPSLPYLMTSAISCMPLGPTSFMRISHSIHMLIAMKRTLNEKALNEITLLGL